MKNIDFIFIGAPKNPSYKTLEQDYHKKIQHYTSSTIFHLKDSAEKNLSKKQKKESEMILSKIKPHDIVVVCDEWGKSIDSKKFSQKINEWQISAQRLVFVIGGAYGMTDDILQKGHFVLKLSEWTLPHELARIVLLEQVYRGLTILKGEKYHH